MYPFTFNQENFPLTDFLRGHCPWRPYQISGMVVGDDDDGDNAEAALV